MSEEPAEEPRIPDVNQGQFGPQEVRAVNETYITSDDFASATASPWVEALRDISHRMNKPGATDWVSDFSTHANLSSHDSMDEYLFNKLSAEGILKSAEPILSNELSAFVFNRLITNYVRHTNQVEAVTNVTEEPLELDQERDVFNFAEVFIDPRTDQAFRLELVKLHYEALQVANKELMSKRRELEENFVDSVRSMVQEGALPESALGGVGKDPLKTKRLKELTVFASDPVVNAFELVGGIYSAEQLVIEIDAATVLGGGRVLQHVYNHERLHAEAGVLTRLETTEAAFRRLSNDQDDTDDVFGHARNAAVDILDLASFDTRPSVPYSGLVKPSVEGTSDLDEAYTEWAAMGLSGDLYTQASLYAEYRRVMNREKDFDQKYGTVYLPERVMMAALVHRGVDLTTLGEAYFESYQPKIDNPGRTPGATIPARRALDKQVAAITPFKSMTQLLNHLDIESAKQGGTPLERKIRKVLILEDQFLLKRLRDGDSKQVD